MSDTMLVQVVEKYGEDSEFKIIKKERPKCKAGYVIIKVKATSINPIDVKIKELGIPGIAPPLPAVLHGDVSGVIEEVGDGVSDFKVGDEVYGCVGGFSNEPGALSEYMPADARLISLKPKNINFIEAATLPLVGITSYESLMDKGLKAKDNILIHGGCGGVGHIAIQMAKTLDTKVYTTVSTKEKKEIALSLGADEVIMYKEESVREYVRRLTGGVGFTLVLDTVGGENISLCLEAVKIRGTVVTIIARGAVVDLSILQAKAASLHAVFMLLSLSTAQGREEHGRILRQVSKWVEAGRIKPLVDKVFNFNEVNEAHSYFKEGKHIGKVAITMD